MRERRPLRREPSCGNDSTLCTHVLVAAPPQPASLHHFSYRASVRLHIAVLAMLCDGAWPLRVAPPFHQRVCSALPGDTHTGVKIHMASTMCPVQSCSTTRRANLFRAVSHSRWLPAFTASLHSMGGDRPLLMYVWVYCCIFGTNLQAQGFLAGC